MGTSDAWLPARYTRPLSPDFPSRGDLLIRFAELAWTTPESPSACIQLDPWQRWLIRAVLEVFPEGHPRAGELRYRQVVISVPRQNGKSLIASLFALYGLLMHVAGPYVVGVAYSAEQARIVYKRVLFAINQKPELKALFKKATETRGIQTANGAGVYEIKASKGAALQGLPLSMCLFDELHIAKPEMWTAVVQGQKTRPSLIIGITTAGDESSELLLNLYDQGARAIEDPESRFGFFCWEAPEGCEINAEAVIASNPAVACGRIDVETVLSDLASQPETDVRRYTLNQFVRGSGTPWIEPGLWGQLEAGQLPGEPTVFTVDASGPALEWVSIAASARLTGEQPRTYVEYVACLHRPDLARLVSVCMDLARRHRATFVMDGYWLKELAAELRRRGLTVVTYTAADAVNAASRAYAQIKQGQVIHDHAEIVNYQIGRGVRRDVKDAWRIGRGPLKDDIDALMATVYAIYAAETIRPRGPLIQ